jgi:TIR domain
MAAPVFLSYAWEDVREVDQLDTMLRLRGVPVWRDRRAMRWGGYGEDLVRRVIRDEASGFALYLTKEALESDFVTDVELRAMDARRCKDQAFFNGAVFRGYGVAAGTEAVHACTGIDVRATLGSRIEERDVHSGLRSVANHIMREYLCSQWTYGPAAVRIETRNALPVDAPSLVHLSLAPPLTHDPCEYDVAVWAEEILPGLHDLQQGLHAVQAAQPSRERVIELDGASHLSAALAVGYAFREPTRWALRIRCCDELWETRRERGDLGGWEVVPHAHGSLLDDAQRTPGQVSAWLVCAARPS